MNSSTTHTPITYIRGKDVERLKQQARKLKREGNLSHTESLDRVAKELGLNDWHYVTQCYQRVKPAEDAFKCGCVLIFDAKEFYEMDLHESDGHFVADSMLELVVGRSLYDTFSNFIDEEDGRTYKESMLPEVLAEEYEMWLMEEGFGYLRLAEPLDKWPLDRVMAEITKQFFWGPWWIIYNGEVIDTSALPATDDEGNVVGVRF
jgi:hypothetical protein